jgi:hypothetical protein
LIINNINILISIFRRRFADHLADISPIPADLRTPVYRTVMANGDGETLAQMQKLFRFVLLG